MYVQTSSLFASSTHKEQMQESVFHCPRRAGRMMRSKACFNLFSNFQAVLSWELSGTVEFTS